jgi:UDP-GlcNAc:undecaprenyl-phosphate GlcNAc-1-phosphate transferase
MAPALHIATAAGETLGLRAIFGPYMIVFFVGFFVAFALTPVLRVLAVRNGIIDWPDLNRKSHPRPVAYLGGLALFLGWLAAVLVSYFAAPRSSVIATHGFVYLPIGVVLGAGAVTLTGLFDDVYGVSPRVKVGGQLFAAAALSMQDTGLNLVSHAFTAFGLNCPPLLAYILGGVLITVLVLGGCNAMNLLDGLDGLATGIGAIAALGFLLIAGLLTLDHLAAGQAPTDLANDPMRLVMCLALLGALLGFLPYNFNPATIFLGDAGSLLLGYLCISAMLLFATSPESSGAIGAPLKTVTACLIVFAVPIIDTSLAIFRRTLRGQPLLSPDREHIHHLLRRSGLSVRQVVLLLYLLAGAFAVVGVSLVALDLRWRYMLAVFVVLYGFVTVSAYKYGQNRRALAQQSGAGAGQPANVDHALLAGAEGSDQPATPGEVKSPATNGEPDGAEAAKGQRVAGQPSATNGNGNGKPADHDAGEPGSADTVEPPAR